MSGHLLPHDQGWPADKALMAELSTLNTQLARYIIRHLDADAGRTDPVSTADERTLSERMATLAAAMHDRARRREVLGPQPVTVEGEATGRPQRR